MSGLRFNPPRDWEVLDLPAVPETVAVIAAEPQGVVERAFRPNFVLTVDDLSLEEQGAGLRSFHLVDREEMDLAGLPCVRTLAHHEIDGHAVVVEQWRVLTPEGSRELTASCGALDYPELAEELTASVASLRLSSE